MVSLTLFLIYIIIQVGLGNDPLKDLEWELLSISLSFLKQWDGNTSRGNLKNQAFLELGDG